MHQEYKEFVEFGIGLVCVTVMFFAGLWLALTGL